MRFICETDDDNNPVVIVGIVAYWIKYRTTPNRILSSFRMEAKPEKTIKEQFDSYTAERYVQFKRNHRDDPETWNWDWDHEFYCKYIIPHEIQLNRQAEALFEYVTEEDVRVVRNVMNYYIEYLKRCRIEKGYRDIPELKILRCLDQKDDAFLENLSNYEFGTIVNSLEQKRFIRVAWMEGHVAEDYQLLDAGRVYLRKLEKEEKNEFSEVERLRKENDELRMKMKKDEEPSEDEIIKELVSCFYGIEEDARAFLKQIRAVAEDREKPAIAKRYLQSQKLSPSSAKRPLWKIMKKYSLYSRGESNWNSMFKKA